MEKTDNPTSTPAPAEAPWTLEKALDMQARANRGEYISREDLRAAVNWLRQSRSAAAALTGSKTSKSKKLSSEEIKEMF